MADAINTARPCRAACDTLKMHIGVVFHQYVGAPFLNYWNEIWHTYRTHLRNYFLQMFGVDRLGYGEQSNIRVLPLLEKPSLTLHSAATHAEMIKILISMIQLRFLVYQ